MLACEPCIMAKSVNITPKGLLPPGKTTRPFELVYSDLSGKQPNQFHRNSQYYFTFIDDFTRMGWVFFLKNKSRAVTVIQEFVAYAEGKFNTTVLCIITDNGSEYMEADKFFRIRGIKHLYTPPYSHESNGVLNDITELYRPWPETCSLSLILQVPTYGQRPTQWLYISEIVYPILSYLRRKYSSGYCITSYLRLGI